MDHTHTLPDDTLADILRHLSPGDLAASRCVRKVWLAVVDAHRLLLPHLLPHALCGLFVNYVDYTRPHFFARPSAKQPAINGNLDFLPNRRHGFNKILDHCNGLLLCRDVGETLCVVNPAMKRWEVLPWREDGNADPHLVFDPATSPHYEVFSIPRVSSKKVILNSPDLSEQYKQKSDFSTISQSLPSESIEGKEDPRDLMDWPPSSWTLNVFSSSTKRWQMRSFVREGEPAGTIANARLDPLEPRCMASVGPRFRYSVYWQGSLYVHCHGAFVVRLSLSDHKYQVIKVSADIEKTKHAQFLGKSEKGVYLATLHDRYQMRVWTLTESSGRIHWVLNHHIDLEPWTEVDLCGLQIFDKTWTIADDDVRYYYYDDEEEEYVYAIVEEESEEEEQEKKEYDKGVQMENNQMVTSEDREWNSDDDNILNIEDYGPHYGSVTFLGFHPYKEVVFLGLRKLLGVAYHLKSSKMQYLGRIHAKDYQSSPSNGIYESFPYTPCMIGELLRHA